MSLDINIPTVKAEVEAAFAKYEQALVGNDVAALGRMFLDHPSTIRYGVAENLYGPDEIAAFRAARSAVGLARTLERTVITTYGRDFAVARRCSAARRRRARSGGRCRRGCAPLMAGASPRHTSR